MTGMEKDLVERLRAAYALVAEWPEHKPDGFANLLALRNLTPEAADAITALKQENERLTQERDEARFLAGLGCDANNGGAHRAEKQGNYTFCATCGETLTQLDLRERCRTAEDRIRVLEEALEPFAMDLGERSTRFFLQLLICPDGDDAEGNFAPHFRRARTASEAKQ